MAISQGRAQSLDFLHLRPSNYSSAEDHQYPLLVYFALVGEMCLNPRPGKAFPLRSARLR